MTRTKNERLRKRTGMQLYEYWLWEGGWEIRTRRQNWEWEMQWEEDGECKRDVKCKKLLNGNEKREWEMQRGCGLELWVEFFYFLTEMCRNKNGKIKSRNEAWNQITSADKVANGFLKWGTRLFEPCYVASTRYCSKAKHVHICTPL